MGADEQEPLLLFLHIRKAAGTTLRAIILEQYGGTIVHASPACLTQNLVVQGEHGQVAVLSFDVAALQSARARYGELDEATKAQIKVIAGQMPFGLHRYLPRPCTYITILRDPVDRVISYYYHVLRHPEHYAHERVVSQRMGLLEFARSGVTNEVDNGQTRVLCGLENPLEAPPFGQCSAEMVEAAKRNLQEHFVVVGLAERFDESLMLLKNRCRWRDPHYARQNVNPNRKRKYDFSLDALREIERHNQVDIELYRYAEERLQAELEQLGSGFPAQIRTFQLANARWREAQARKQAPTRMSESKQRRKTVFRVLAFIENDMYVRNFVTSGALDLLMQAEGFGICVSKMVRRLRSSIPADRIRGVYEWNQNNLDLVYQLNKVSTLALREKSSTLDIKAEACLFGEYTPDEMVLASARDFGMTRGFFVRRLKDNPSLERIVAQYRPHLAVFPITGVEATGAELVSLSRRHGFRTLFLVNGWDNLCSKGVFPLLPDYLGAWGPQSLVDAVDIQGMRPHRIFLLGCARYEDYFRPGVADQSPFPHKYILFAGATTPCDELTPLRHCEEVLEETGVSDVKVVYRPHPWREKRKCFDLFEPEKYQHVMLDPQIAADYFKEKRQDTESVSSQNFPALGYYPSLVNHALFVISPMSSMTLEAALFDVPALVLAHDDGYHPIPPHLQAEYHHFEGADEMPGWFFVRELAELKARFRSLVERFRDESPSKREFRPALSLATARYLYQDEKSYAQRLYEATQVIRATIESNGHLARRHAEGEAPATVES